MNYLLDTNICVFLFRGKYGVNAKINEVGIENCCISEVTVAELQYGVACSTDKEKNASVLESFLQDIKVIPFTSITQCFANEKARLRKLGTPIDDFDLLIACSAIVSNSILVTDNVKHFAKVENITIENWIER